MRPLPFLLLLLSAGAAAAQQPGTAGDAVVDVVQRALGGPRWWADE